MANEERDKVIRTLQWFYNNDFLFRSTGDFKHAVKLAIQALKQEPVLDKIRAEIEALPKAYPFTNHIDTYVKEDDVKKIIDKYMTESEVRNDSIQYVYG